MNQDSESVISVKNLTQRYGTGRVIYSDLSFEVPKGRILGLLGKNGTGKTTTINIRDWAIIDGLRGASVGFLVRKSLKSLRQHGHALHCSLKAMCSMPS